MTIDTQKYLENFSADKSSVGDHWFMIGFFPSSIPPKLKLDGLRDLVLTVKVHQTAAVQEQPPEKPRLAVSPNRIFTLIQGLNAKDQIGSSLIVYTGEQTVIDEMRITGSGASKFSIMAPGLPFPLKAGSDGTRLQVRFAVAQEDLASYDAILTISTANNTVANVLLRGQRQNF